MFPIENQKNRKTLNEYPLNIMCGPEVKLRHIGNYKQNPSWICQFWCWYSPHQNACLLHNQKLSKSPSTRHWMPWVKMKNIKTIHCLSHNLTIRRLSPLPAASLLWSWWWRPPQPQTGSRVTAGGKASSRSVSMNTPPCLSPSASRPRQDAARPEEPVSDQMMIMKTE